MFSNPGAGLGNRGSQMEGDAHCASPSVVSQVEVQQLEEPQFGTSAPGMHT